MKAIICPGIHDVQLTELFLKNLLIIDPKVTKQTVSTNWLIFPTERNPAYSPFHLYNWLNRSEILNDELFFIAFSAGVVSAISAAVFLQLRGVKIRGLIAIDGWGVPLWANFPVYRLSHDYFTHWSSAILGTGKSSFYCDPSVEHLTLWSYPENCQGWILKREKDGQEIYLKRSSALDYLQEIIRSKSIDC